MNRIREVLRNEYVGAVAIGFLFAQVIGIVISLVMRPVNFFVERASRPGAFGRVDTETFPWASLISPALNVLLLGLISFLLLRWLYPKAAVQQHAGEAASNATEESGGPE